MMTLEEKRLVRNAYHRLYYRKNRKKIIRYHVEWAKRHRDQINKRQKKWFKLKFRSDPIFRERERQRGLRKYRKFRAKYLLRCERIKHTAAFRAVQKLNYAIRHKYILRPSICDACGVKAKIQGHHHRGYNRPLDVIWLCKLCHESLHHP